MDGFLDIYQVHWLNQDQINNLNSPKNPKEIKAVIKSLPTKEQQHQPIRPPQSSQGLNHQPKVHMEGPMAPAAYAAEDGLVWHQ